METLNINNTAWAVVNGMFGEDAKERLEYEDFRNTRRFKKAVKSYVKTMLDAEVVADFNALLEAIDMNIHARVDEINEALEGLNISAIVRPEPIDKDMATDEEVAEWRRSWAEWNLVESLRLYEVRRKANEVLVDGGKKLFNKLLVTLYSNYAKIGRDEVIINSVIASLGRVLGSKDFELIMAVLEIINTQGFIRLHKSKTLESRWEFVYSVPNFDNNLYEVYLQTDKRYPHVFKPEMVDLSKDIVTKKYVDFEQSVEPMADVVDYLNSVAFSFADDVSEDEISDMADDLIADEYGSAVYDEAWKRRIKNDLLYDFLMVKDFGNRFYNTRISDGVGRLYENSKFSFINGESYRENIEFANKEVLTDEGRKWLKILAVDKAGYKVDGMKPTEEEALAYYEANESSLDAKIVSIINSDEATGIAVELDAQTQGASLYGALLADEHMLVSTGLIGSSFRTDYYLALANSMNRYIGKEVYDRKSVKTAFMTTGYGAGYKTVMFGNGDFDFDTGDYTVEAKSKKQVPLMETAEAHGITNTRTIWKAFKSSMNALAPKMLEVNSELEEICKVLNQDEISWIMPDGVRASIIGNDTEEIHIDWIDHNVKTHTVAHNVRVRAVNSSKSLAPRVIQSVDAYILRLVVRDMANEGVDIATVHDAYFVHPNNGDLVRDAYKRAVAHVMEIDLLTDIVSQITGVEVASYQDKFRRRNETKAKVEDILNSKYALYI